MPTTDAKRRVIITVDGPAGTGKSTVAHLLARRLGLEFLDTGAMYRAAALLALEQGIRPSDGKRLAAAVREVDMHFDWTATPPMLMLGERAVGERIRDADVSEAVSIVAAQKELRDVLVEIQQRIGAEHARLVTEGRDQGSVVFPDAPLKFYLDADVAIRARRRVGQLSAMGRTVDEAEVISRIRERDRIDSTRADGPLVRPEDAITVDTSRRTLEDVVDRLEEEARTRLPDADFER